MSTDTSWIREGAEVVIYSYGGGIRPAWARATTIVSVAKQSFRVDGFMHRIALDNQTHRGGTWDPSTHVIPISDPRAEVLLREEVSRRLLRTAQKRTEEFLKDSTPATVEAALKALRALQADQQTIAEHQAGSPPCAR
jgi:hypothetical protein